LNALLTANDIPIQRSPNGVVWVAPQDANGGVLQFAQA
jgi:hypothetical protein